MGMILKKLTVNNSQSRVVRGRIDQMRLMVSKLRIRNVLLVPLILGWFLQGCQTPPIEGKTEAEKLYQEAKRYMERERYILATEKLNKIKLHFPYSYYATSADLLLADILFVQENYIEAQAAYLVFLDLHPKYKDRDYVIFKIAESYYLELPSTHDRDLASATKAITFYKKLQEEFPQSQYVQEVVQKIGRCEDMLKQKDRYVADFYFKTERFYAAKYRFSDMIKKYSSDEETVSYAVFKMIDSLYHLDDFRGCVEFYDQHLNISENYKKKVQSIYEKCQQKKDTVTTSQAPEEAPANKSTFESGENRGSSESADWNLENSL